jgi:Flp pilus assembly protein TadB
MALILCLLVAYFVWIVIARHVYGSAVGLVIVVLLLVTLGNLYRNEMNRRKRRSDRPPELKAA